jgi:signal transduction histidine kinase
VVSNLLTNALKFTQAGGRVELATGPAGGDAGGARLSVADSGPGIPPDELPHVFERFWRGAQARSVTGSGIGLTIVQRLGEAHAGTIRIESEPGAGTRVSVILPAAGVPVKG